MFMGSVCQYSTWICMYQWIFYAWNHKTNVTVTGNIHFQKHGLNQWWFV